MNREEIENIIKDTHPETYITTTKLFLDEILPEVLKGVDTMEIDVEISLLDTMNDDFKRGFNSCWGAIKKSLSKKYNITL